MTNRTGKTQIWKHRVYEVVRGNYIWKKSNLCISQFERGQILTASLFQAQSKIVQARTQTVYIHYCYSRSVMVCTSIFDQAQKLTSSIVFVTSSLPMA